MEAIETRKLGFCALKSLLKTDFPDLINNHPPSHFKTIFKDPQYHFILLFIYVVVLMRAVIFVSLNTFI